MKWGSKFDDFVKTRAEVEFLEGTTLAGKTTVGLYKFMLMVAVSSKNQHILAALDKGVIEKNLINKDHGIQEEFGSLIEYFGNGRGNESIPHILFMPDKDTEKVIYCLGYDDKKRWQKALGGQYGCLYIDEINTADMDFVREASMRSDYLMGTLNPDDPSLPIYDEYINHSRPLDKWRDETPKEILEDLVQEPKPKWVHWFFGFKDNISLTQAKIDQATRNVPEGTKLYKNKILGLRGRATGLVFPNFTDDYIITDKWLNERVKSGEIKFQQFSCGVDTSYSAHSSDTISMHFIGITTDSTIIVLRERVYNNADRSIPIAPSDTVVKLIEFMEQNRKEFGLCLNLFIDSADQATITEAKKYKLNEGTMYVFNDSYKGVKIIDRINHKLGWIAKGKYLVHESCKEHIREMNAYSWKDDKDEPEDRNNHTIDAVDYAWMPYRRLIGVKE